MIRNRTVANTVQVFRMFAKIFCTFLPEQGGAVGFHPEIEKICHS
jgi:hypothetical protein